MQTQTTSSSYNLAEMPKVKPAWQLLKTVKMVLQPLQYVEQMQALYGNLFQDTGMGTPSITVSEPQAIQEIFTADAKLFQPAETIRILEPLVGSNSLFLLHGEAHQQRRKLLMPQFHGERIKAYADIIGDTTAKVMDSLPRDRPFLARNAMQSISLEIILRSVFGLQEGDRYRDIKLILTEMLDVFNSPINAIFFFFKSLQRNWGPWGKFIKAREQLSKLLYAEIAQRRQQNSDRGQDILSLLLSVKDEDGNSLTDAELKDELITMLFAGHETTAISIAWALYWIHYEPGVKDKLLAEIDSLAGNLDANEILKLSYLNAVCCETLRLCPVTPFAFPRRLDRPMKLMNYQVEKGADLAIAIYLVHHRPDIYPEPKRFNPNRFLERQFSPYEYLPFGGGHRRCLGMVFALFEMKLVLATIIAKYEIESLETEYLTPVRRGLVFGPPGGVRLRTSGWRSR